MRTSFAILALLIFHLPSALAAPEALSSCMANANRQPYQVDTDRLLVGCLQSHLNEMTTGECLKLVGHMYGGNKERYLSSCLKTVAPGDSLGCLRIANAYGDKTNREVQRMTCINEKSSIEDCLTIASSMEYPTNREIAENSCARLSHQEIRASPVSAEAQPEATR